MPAGDPLAKLKALTKSQSGDASFQHESEEDVIRRLTGILGRVPRGKYLLDSAERHGTQIKLLKGKNEFTYSPETNTLWLGLPGGQNMPKARMLLFLTMGLREAHQEFEGAPRPPVNMPAAQFGEIHHQKQTDILLELIKVTHELVNQLGLREILDELKKLGHYNIYEAYEEDLRNPL